MADLIYCHCNRLDKNLLFLPGIMNELTSYLTPSRTINRLNYFLFILALCRYATPEQLKICKKQSIDKHIATKQSLQALCDLEIIASSNGAFFISDKGWELLEKTDYPISHLSKRKRAEPAEHTLKITDHLLSVIEDDNFYTAIYPQFDIKGWPSLIPDLGLVYYNGQECKLVFVEVELSAKTDGYLEDKMRRYRIIAKQKETYDWWIRLCKQIKLPECKITDFRFSVEVAGGQ